jgi:hypothetical protein
MKNMVGDNMNKRQCLDNQDVRVLSRGRRYSPATTKSKSDKEGTKLEEAATGSNKSNKSDETLA